MDFLTAMSSANNVFDQLQHYLGAIGTIFVLFSLLCSLINCFFGFKIFRAVVTIIGFVIFGFIAMAAAPGDTILLELALILLVALLGGFLAYKLYLVSVFLYSFFLGGLGAFLLSLAAGFSISSACIATFAIAIIAGILAVMMARPMLIITSAFSGGMSAGSALASLMDQSSIETVLGVVLVLCGIAFQFYSTRPKVAAVAAPTTTEAAPVADTASQPADVAPPQPVATPDSTSIHCPSCGQSATGDSLFCGSCGAKL